MADFKFLKDKWGRWVVSAPKRAKRPNEAKGDEPLCPFCPGNESNEEEVYRVGGADSDWKVWVVKNKYPFAEVHEIVVHSPDHHKNFDELPLPQNELILQTFRKRFNEYKGKGQVYIFHNKGDKSGESLTHPHSQIAVIPKRVKLEIPPLDRSDNTGLFDAGLFDIFCPKTSRWPDEVWIAPKKKGALFGEITDEEIRVFAKLLYRLIQIMDIRHGHEFSFNFYIYPLKDWYLRLIPREKILGAFELGTGIVINTQDPSETFRFINDHFNEPNIEKIRENRAEYHRKA